MEKKHTMKCDICFGRDLNEVLILRKEKFAKSCSGRYNRARRICWDCAKMLFRRKLYNFGRNWRDVFLDGSLILKKNYAKYLVIHA